MGANWNDVRFDYDGSLVLARRLWLLADLLDDRAIGRRDTGDEALVGWLGPLGVEFAGRVATEAADLQRIATELRLAANGWAQAWADALNEQNWRSFARACDVVRSRRSNWDKIGGFFTGHDDLPPEPSTRTTPTAPSFRPTGTFAIYQALR
jgi:hypothetical protein